MKPNICVYPLLLYRQIGGITTIVDIFLLPSLYHSLLFKKVIRRIFDFINRLFGYMSINLRCYWAVTPPQ